jgi:hypothetical protein
MITATVTNGAPVSLSLKNVDKSYVWLV